MQNRINGLGVSEPEIRKQGTNQIVIQLAGVHNAAKAAALIGKTAQLQLFDFENDLVTPSIDANGNPVATPSLYDAAHAGAEAGDAWLTRVVLPVQDEDDDGKATKKGAKPTTTTTHSLKGSAPTRSELLKPFGGKVPKGDVVLKVPAHRIVVSCRRRDRLPRRRERVDDGHLLLPAEVLPAGDGQPGPQIPEMTGNDLVLSGTRADFGPTGGPVVLLQFTNHGSNVFQKITKAEAQRGSFRFQRAGSQGDYTNYAQHFAIVLDGQLESTPYIDFKQNPDGIPGPNAEIDLGNGGTIGQAKDLALVLQTGALPVSFKQIERTDVSATLGKSSLTQAWHAALIGLLVVALFLLILYRFLGLVAVVGLAIYALLYYAAILLFHVTLTLPGFAGLILTIGVAADANVVVFERIKEEVRAGKSVRAAIAAGYGKGFHTILDANVVTAITALVLFLVAIASVKGFALMLLIGTMISLLTAVAATRAMLHLLSGFRWFDNPRFMGAQGQQTAKWLQIDFMKRRYLWFAISGLIIIAGAVSLGVRGLNLGIDFKGGAQVTLQHAQGLHDQRRSRNIAKRDRPERTRSSRVAARPSTATYKTWQVRTRSLTGARAEHVPAGSPARRSARTSSARRTSRRASVIRSRSTRSGGSSSRCS